jgi:hypothetical protein
MRQQQMVSYADDERATEMELAAAERHTSCCSCSPFGKMMMVSRAIKGGEGREGQRRRRPKKEMFDYAVAYPPAQTYYVRPNARTTTDNNHHPVSAQVHTVQPEEPTTRSYAAVPGASHPQSSGGAGKPRKKKNKNKKKRVTFNPETTGGPMMPPANAPPQHDAHHPQQHAETAASNTGPSGGSGYNQHRGGEEPYSPAPPPAVHGHGGHAAYGYGYCRGYAPLPLTTRREEVLGTPRRYEYFSGEYRWYYPTPVRESIYSFATDANHRLTAFFSEENPNACTIV